MTYTSWASLQEAYDELLDEPGDIVIDEQRFRPSEVLRGLRPIAYRVGLFDFAEAEQVDTTDFPDWFQT